MIFQPSVIWTCDAQGFPGRRILRLLLSKTSLGPPKNYHVRPLGLARICKEVKKE